MKQGYSQSDRINTELKQMKDLCLKLDHEKDELRRELRNRDDQRQMVSKLNVFNKIKGSQVNSSFFNQFMSRNSEYRLYALVQVSTNSK